MSAAEKSAPLDERVTELERRADAIEMRFAAAFPGGDYEGHRRYHDLIIEHTVEVKRLRRVIFEKTISGLVWALLVVVGIAMFRYLKDLLGIGA